MKQAKQSIHQLIINSLEDSKSKNTVAIALPKDHSLTSEIIITEGTSSRHVKSIADNLVEESKNQGYRPIGVEGMDESKWILVDLNDAIVHIMQAETREFYQLEKLWQHVLEDESNTTKEKQQQSQ